MKNMYKINEIIGVGPNEYFEYEGGLYYIDNDGWIVRKNPLPGPFMTIKVCDMINHPEKIKRLLPPTALQTSILRLLSDLGYKYLYMDNDETVVATVNLITEFTSVVFDIGDRFGSEILEMLKYRGVQNGSYYSIEGILNRDECIKYSCSNRIRTSVKEYLNK